MKSSQTGKVPQLRGLFLFLILVLVLGVVFLNVNALSGFRLEVTNVASGQIIMDFPVVEGESIQIHYTHSVDGLPVRETFRLVQGELVLDQVQWMSFGAGLGYMGQGELKVKDEWVVIEKMNRNVGVLLLRVGTIANHSLVYRGKEYPLKDYAKGMELLSLAVSNHKP